MRALWYRDSVLLQAAVLRHGDDALQGAWAHSQERAGSPSLGRQHLLCSMMALKPTAGWTTDLLFATVMITSAVCYCSAVEGLKLPLSKAVLKACDAASRGPHSCGWLLQDAVNSYSGNAPALQPAPTGLKPPAEVRCMGLLQEVVDDPSGNKMLLVMDYMEGGPVMTREALEKGRCIPEPLARQYFRDMCKVGCPSEGVVSHMSCLSL